MAKLHRLVLRSKRSRRWEHTITWAKLPVRDVKQVAIQRRRVPAATKSIARAFSTMTTD